MIKLEIEDFSGDTLKISITEEGDVFFECSCIELLFTHEQAQQIINFLTKQIKDE